MRRALTILFLITLEVCVYAQQPASLTSADKIRIREAMTLSRKFGPELFPGYESVPFAIILIKDSIDYLLNHPCPSSDFKLLENDSLLSTAVYFRKSNFNPHILATFPAVNGLSCIVVGTPENTGKNSTEWIITLLHEHFHQYQNADPDYYKMVDDLDLSNGDQTGLWMLNFPFPYDSAIVGKQFTSFSKALYDAAKNIDAKNSASYLSNYKKERKKLQNVLPPAAYRYFSLQIWQEGLARYAEYLFLDRIAAYQPSKEVLALPDFVSFDSVKTKMRRDEMNNLLTGKLDQNKRVSFYSVGFAEGLLLDKVNKQWRKKYLTDKFYIEKYYN